MRDPNADSPRRSRCWPLFPFPPQSPRSTRRAGGERAPRPLGDSEGDPRSDPPHPLSRPSVSLLVLCTLAAAALVLGAQSGHMGPGGLALLWLLACLGGEIFWFRTPGYDSTLSLAFTLDVAAVASLPPAEALVVVGASTFIAGTFAHRRAWYRVAFNVAQSVLAAGAASLVFGVMANAGGVPESATIPTLALISAGIVFYLVNTALVAAAVGFSSEQSPFMVWLDCYGTPMELAGTLGQLSLAYFVAMATHVVGPFALLGAFPVLLALWFGSPGRDGANVSLTAGPASE